LSSQAGCWMSPSGSAKVPTSRGARVAINARGAVTEVADADDLRAFDPVRWTTSEFQGLSVDVDSRAQRWMPFAMVPARNRTQGQYSAVSLDRTLQRVRAGVACHRRVGRVPLCWHHRRRRAHAIAWHGVPASSYEQQRSQHLKQYFASLAVACSLWRAPAYKYNMRHDRIGLLIHYTS
jgi:hypothetical protein